MVEIQDQTSRLTGIQLLIVFLGLNLALLISFLDSTSVSTALPDIASDLKAGNSISWTGTSFLVANTGFQIITARLSDIFGRKAVLISCLFLFGFGDLLCGFATSEAWLYACRSIAGIGGGGINSLTMIILSDIVSIEKRAKYQGLLGISIALGSGIGPLIGGSLAEKASWRWTFWFTVPLTLCTILVIGILLPLKHVKGGAKEKLKQIDWLGSMLSLAAIVMILVPISGGGTLYEWVSPTFLVLLITGLTLAVIFVLVEFKYAKLPVMPLHMFRVPTVSLILMQTFFVGMIFYGGMFFTPIYLQNVLGYSPIMSGVLILPLVLIQVFSTSAMGFITEKTDSLKPWIILGFSIWLVGQAAQTVFDRTTSVAKIVVILLIQGIGVGGTLQTLVLAQASAPPLDRAVVTGTRNFARTSGGALGLAASNAILNNLFSKNLPESLSPSLRTGLLESISNMPADLDAQTRDAILNAYNDAIHWVFVYFAPVIGLCLFLSFFMTDQHLRRRGSNDDSKVSAAKGDHEQGTIDEKHSAKNKENAISNVTTMFVVSRSPSRS
ncbi:MFS transporter M2 [Psilocybe cubensis]|uniref:Major facilitator superfamily (MFS) profile domain-containing protein n=2 Tax=Psilocybe cubensis TaxID=181762 RepID=A0A8H7Y8H5_PSICU|nr:MFS transporter M2 [Psilocybe cubensis]KAH9487281.1 MFS transporter M2 [Psilocybe cubensis]